jgi:hypothetical protein
VAFNGVATSPAPARERVIGAIAMRLFRRVLPTWIGVKRSALLIVKPQRKKDY